MRLVIWLSLFMLYVVLDGVTPLGTIEANNKTKGDWAEYTLIPVDESYRGKQHYEIKYSGGKLRHATKEEIATYKQERKDEAKAAKKQNALDTLEITEGHLNKIKAL